MLPTMTEDQFENAAAVRETILVVDDDRINRMVVRVLMERRHYRVLEAESGPEALKFFDDEEIKLILMDLSMPGMDGLETTRRIRSQQSGGAVPIVALTAHTSQADRDMCLEAGMNTVLRKPFDSQQLDRLMRLLKGDFLGRDT